MGDLISRQALRSEMYHEAFEKDSNEQRWDSGCWIRYKMFERIVDRQPSAQRTGRWIDDELMCKARCSVCGEEFSWMDNDMDRFWFCPNCGSYNGVEHE